MNTSQTELSKQLGHFALNKRDIARAVQRVPWALYWAKRVYRKFQPHVTAGCVGAVFNRTGQLLVVEHVLHPLSPWGLPGGWMSPNEEPAETVRREVLEETSLRVQIIKPLVISRTEWLPAHLDIAYLCNLPPDQADDAVTLSSELLDYAWIDPTKLPPMVPFHRDVVRIALIERNAAPELTTKLPPYEVAHEPIL